MTDEELYQLTQKFLQGTLTAEERKLLDEWYSENTDKSIFIESPYSGERELSAKLYSTIQGNNKNKQRFIRFAAAAAILILIGTSVYFGMIRTITKQSQLASQTAALPEPGSDRAILTLADGTKIVLDSVGNGEISEQSGAQVIKQSDGQLEYRPVNSTKTQDIVYNTMSTPRGGQYHLRLPDGSEVWLNAASSITFPVSFAKNERTVSVSGEAYFEIKKDKSRPFKVSAENAMVEVLGTGFNINAYDDEPSVNTTLVEGSVRVSAKHRSVLLKPEQTAISYSDNSSKIDLQKADINSVLAWKNGYFKFNNTSLTSFMRQLSRWYNVDIGYEGKIPTTTFNGGIKRTASFNSIIEFLKQQDIIVQQKGKQIIISSK